METFVVAKQYLILLGAIPIPLDRLPKRLQNHHKAIDRGRVAFIFLALILAVVSSLYATQLDNEDKPEAEFFALCTVFVILIYSIFIWKETELVELMDALKKLIETRMIIF